MGIILFVYSFFIEGILEELNIFWLVTVPFILCVLLIFIDVSTDAWSIILVDKEYLGYARSMKLIGQNVGAIFTFNIFIELNSAKFSNKYLNKNAQSEGLISN